MFGILKTRVSEADRSAREGTYKWKSSERYVGAVLEMTLKQTVAILYSILRAIGSQWSSTKRGVTCSRLDDLQIKRAAQFITLCSLSMCFCGMPARSELQ